MASKGLHLPKIRARVYRLCLVRAALPIGNCLRPRDTLGWDGRQVVLGVASHHLRAPQVGVGRIALHFAAQNRLY